jgi:hypothetical protein
VGLTQLVRFLVVELTHPDLTWVLHLRLIILSVGGDVPIDSETLLVTDFVNLKIKPAQSFGSDHKGRVCVRVFIGVSARTCMSIYVCTVFLNVGLGVGEMAHTDKTKLIEHGQHA